MDELYQAQILALARSSRAGDLIACPTHQAVARNPVCGDEVTLRLLINNDVISQAHVEVKGCALCEAGAGLLSQHAIGKSLTALQTMGHDLDAFLKDGASDKPDFSPFTPVKLVKNRHKCVTLAFKTAEKMT